MKTFMIKTIKDIVDNVPEDRIDYFLTDLKAYLSIRYATKSLVDTGIATHEGMQWYDDGEHNAETIITIK